MSQIWISKLAWILELSLALRFDETLRGAIQAEVRVLDQLPLSVKGRILGEAQLIYSRAEEKTGGV